MKLFFNIFFGPISRQGGGREKITLEMEVALLYKLFTLQNTSYSAYTALLCLNLQNGFLAFCASEELVLDGWNALWVKAN